MVVWVIDVTRSIVVYTKKEDKIIVVDNHKILAAVGYVMISISSIAAIDVDDDGV